MLNIYYGDMKEAVYNTSAYFKYDYEDSWIVDPFVKEMIQESVNNPTGRPVELICDKKGF